MGEYAEMMLDGTCCEGCGVFIGEGGEGFPRYCSPECQPDYAVIDAKPYKCGACGKGFKTKGGREQHRQHRHEHSRLKCKKCGKVCKGAYGLAMHTEAKHGSAQEEHDDFDVLDDFNQHGE